MANAGDNGQPRRGGRGRFSLADAAVLPLTGERHPLRRGAGRTLLVANAVALGGGCLLLACWLTIGGGADLEDGRTARRLPERQFRPGLRGPLLIMGELAARSGDDPVAREGRPAVAGPAPKPGPRPAAGEPAARPQGEPGPATGLPVPVPAAQGAAGAGLDAEASGNAAGAAGSEGVIEMNVPAQFNPCFVLRTLVRPAYPVAASAEARRLPSVTVEAAFYVDVGGAVTASYILRSEAEAAFDQAVLDAVNQWLFEPVADPSCQPLGFWVRLPVVFRGPDARTFNRTR